MQKLLKGNKFKIVNGNQSINLKRYFSFYFKTYFKNYKISTNGTPQNNKNNILTKSITKEKKNYFNTKSIVSISSNTQLQSFKKEGLNLEVIIQKYGSYSNYIQNIGNINIVNEEFIKDNYPSFLNDPKFKIFLNELEPLFRNDVNFVIYLYELLTLYNEKIDNLILNYDKFYSDKDMFKYFIDLLIANIKNLIKNFNNDVFAHNNEYISEFLKKVNNKILISSFETKMINDIKKSNNYNSDKFEETFKFIKENKMEGMNYN